MEKIENKNILEELYMTKEQSEMFSAGREYEKRIHKCPKKLKPKIIYVKKIKIVKEPVKRWGARSGKILLNQKFETEIEAKEFINFNSRGRNVDCIAIKMF